MSVYSELIQKNVAFKSAEKELRVLKAQCIEEMKKEGTNKLSVPNMGTISLQSKKPSKSKINDPEIMLLKEQIEEAKDNLAKELKKEIYGNQRKIFLLDREIHSMLRTTDIVEMEQNLFQKVHEYLCREATEFVVVRTRNG